MNNCTMTMNDLASTRSSCRQMRCVPFSKGCRGTPISRSRNVTVEAKGQKRNMVKMQNLSLTEQLGAQQMMGEPPAPDVDPENAEFVIFVRAKKFMQGKIEMSNSRWIPLSVVKGGQAANILVKTMETEWGQKLFAKTLVRNIAQAVYKDRANVEKSIKDNIPLFKGVSSKDFEYAFKVRDPSVPKDWYKAVDLTTFPAEIDLEFNAFDALKTFFSLENVSTLFSAPAPAETKKSS